MAQAPSFPPPSQSEQNALDEALNETFPASDPVSLADPTHGMRSDHSAPDEAAIRQRAYEIWQQAGAPHGSHEEHWAQARSELEAEAAGAAASDRAPLTPTEADEVR